MHTSALYKQYQSLLVLDGYLLYKLRTTHNPFMTQTCSPHICCDKTLAEVVPLLSSSGICLDVTGALFCPSELLMN